MIRSGQAGRADKAVAQVRNGKDVVYINAVLRPGGMNYFPAAQTHSDMIDRAFFIAEKQRVPGDKRMLDFVPLIELHMRIAPQLDPAAAVNQLDQTGAIDPERARPAP